MSCRTSWWTLSRCSPGGQGDSVEQVEGGREQQARVLAHQRLGQRQHPARHRRGLPMDPELLDRLLHQTSGGGEVSGGKPVGNGL